MFYLTYVYLLALFNLFSIIKTMIKKSNYDKYDAGQGFLFAFFMPFVISLVYMFVVYIVGTIFNVNLENISENSVYIAFASLVSPISFVLTFVIINKTQRVDYVSALGVKSKINLKYLLVTIVLSLVCVFGMSNFVNLFDALIAKIGFVGSYSLPLPLDNFGYLVLNLFLLAVLPSICEELVFRGVIFSGLKQYGDMKAVFLSATLFMLVHSSVEQTVYPFFVGVVLALLMLRTNNIIYPIILHFLNNAIVVIMNYVSQNNGVGFILNTYNILFAILLAILSVLCVIIIFKLLLKKINKTKYTQQLPKENYSSPNTLLYVGIIGAIIIWIFDLISGFVA